MFPEIFRSVRGTDYSWSCNSLPQHGSALVLSHHIELSASIGGECPILVAGFPALACFECVGDQNRPNYPFEVIRRNAGCPRSRAFETRVNYNPDVVVASRWIGKHAGCPRSRAFETWVNYNPDIVVARDGLASTLP